MNGLLEMVRSSDYTGSKLDLLLLQVSAGVVELVMIEVIDHKMRRRLQEGAVHGNNDFLPVDRVTANRITLGVETPAIHEQEFEVLVINKSELTFSQGNKLWHEESLRYKMREAHQARGMK